jgi:hypothetical protein
MKGWQAQVHLLRPGDGLILLLAVAACVALWPLAWRGGAADRVEIRQNGTVIAEISLNLTTPRHLEVAGPLGITVIEVEPGRARVASDPGPRQYCVQQGWLKRANAVAICAPNRVSLRLLGGREDHDTLSY